MPSHGNTIYFFREYEEPHGFLSQWYECPFTVDGRTYFSTEHWMMVHKARTFGDAATEREMWRTKEPRRHKALGRQVVGFSAAEWDKHKEKVVEEGNYHKFTKTRAEEGLKEKLLATGNKELAEASPFDHVWGIGFAAKDAGRLRDDWGQNLLGKALERVRTRIRAEEEGGGGDA